MGEKNPGDVWTKPKSANEMEEMIKTVGGEIISRDIWRDVSTVKRVRWCEARVSD